MKKITKKAFAIGCGLPVALVLLASAALYYEGHKKLDYRETGYRKDYSWNGIEVGVVMRFPVNTPIPIGRYCAVIAFKSGQMTGARTMFQGPFGEVPERPEFVSGQEQTVIYRTKTKGTITLDLSRWQTYPTSDSVPAESTGSRSP